MSNRGWQTYYIEYEVREIGAIGVFYKIWDTIDAVTADIAKEHFRQKYNKQYEFRFCTCCWGVS